MTNVTPIVRHVDYSDIMITSEVAQLLRCSPGQVRALTERKWHPLPCSNKGVGHKKQRVFRRSSVLRWMGEEEKLEKPVEAEKPKERRKQSA